MVFLGAGVILAIGDLVVGLESAPMLARLMLIVLSVVIALIGYRGVKWVLGLQLRHHGPKRWLRQFATLTFGIFLLFSLIALARAPFVLGAEPLSAPFALFASIAFGSLAVRSELARASEETESNIAV